MKIAVRRRLAAAAVLSMTATVGAVALTVGTSSAAINGASPNIVGNFPSFGQPVTVTFTTGRPAPAPAGDGGSVVPVGSDVFWQLPGGNSFDSNVETVTPNSSGGQTIQTTVDFSDTNDPTTNAGTGAGFFGGDGPADPGVYDVTIRSNDPSATTLQKCTACVTVFAAGPPSLTSANPNAVAANTTDAPVTFKGTNFARDTAFRVLPVTGNSATDIKVSRDDRTNGPGSPSADGTTWYGLVTVPAGAQLGLHDVQVTNTDGQTSICSGCFTVLGANLTAVNPTSWTNNDTDSAKSITFTGPAGSIAPDAVPSLQFVNDPGATARDALAIPATSVTARAADGTSITATYNLAAAAPGLNAYQPRLQSPAGVTTNVCTCRFSISQPGAPTVTSISPSSQPAGTTQTVTVGGTNFAKGTNVTIAGGGVTTTAVEYVSRTQIKATLTVASSATSGKRDVTVTLTDGQKNTLAGGYTITAGASASSSASSSSSPCPTSSASASPSRSGTASPTSSATATAALVPMFRIRATSSPSDTATASTSPTASASRSASPSGTPSSCAPLQIAVSPADIVPTQASTVFLKGSPGQAVELYAYTRPSTTYSVVRSGRTNSSGSLTFQVTPGANTRLYAHYVGSTSSTDSPSVVINVHTSLSLSAYRDGVRKYHFQGTNLPRRPGQLITLYRYAKGPNLDQYCVPPAESDVKPQANNGCTAIRTATAYTNSSNVWRIDRTFTGSGQFYFVVRTSQTLNNGRGHSNQRLTVIH